MRNKTAYRVLCELDEKENALPVYFQLVMGIVGNVLAVGILWTSRLHHQWRSFYIFFAGLVMTDLLNNCACYPLVLRRYVSHFTWCLSEPLCDFLSFVETFCHLTSGMIVCAMTIDRYLHLTLISRQSTAASRLKYLGVLSVLLLVSALISSFQLVGIGNSQLYYPGSWCFLDFTSKSFGNRIAAYVYSGLGISIMTSTFIIGMMTLRITCRNAENQALLLDNSLVSGVYDKHVTAFLITSIFTFVFLWGPLLIDMFLHAAGLSKSNDKKELWLVRLMYLNTQINPWLYVILRKESMRRFYVMILRCTRFCRSEDDDQRYSEVTDFAGDD